MADTMRRRIVYVALADAALGVCVWFAFGGYALVLFTFGVLWGAVTHAGYLLPLPPSSTAPPPPAGPPESKAFNLQGDAGAVIVRDSRVVDANEDDADRWLERDPQERGHAGGWR